METIIKKIPVKLDSEDVIKKLHLDKKKGVDYIHNLVELANSITSPKALYGVAYINSVKSNKLSINTVEFNSHVLSENLHNIGRVFPYVITIGQELEAKSTTLKLFKQYCLEEIGNITLRETVKYLADYLKSEYKIKQLSRMSPGRLPDWPITEQKQLFSLFGDVERLVGVRLNENMLMIPKKSVSGIFFPTEILFESCQLCPREKCEARKAPYDSKLVKKYSL